MKESYLASGNTNLVMFQYMVQERMLKERISGWNMRLWIHAGLSDLQTSIHFICNRCLHPRIKVKFDSNCRFY